jgi:hypothetical protein
MPHASSSPSISPASRRQRHCVIMCVCRHLAGQSCTTRFPVEHSGNLFLKRAASHGELGHSLDREPEQRLAIRIAAKSAAVRAFQMPATPRYHY